ATTRAAPISAPSSKRATSQLGLMASPPKGSKPVNRMRASGLTAWLAITTAPWRLDHEHIAWRHLYRADVWQRFDAPIQALNAIRPRRTRLPTGHAESRVHAP